MQYPTLDNASTISRASRAIPRDRPASNRFFFRERGAYFPPFDRSHLQRKRRRREGNRPTRRQVPVNFRDVSGQFIIGLSRLSIGIIARIVRALGVRIRPLGVVAREETIVSLLKTNATRRGVIPGGEKQVDHLYIYRRNESARKLPSSLQFHPSSLSLSLSPPPGEVGAENEKFPSAVEFRRQKNS